MFSVEISWTICNDDSTDSCENRKKWKSWEKMSKTKISHFSLEGIFVEI